MQDGLLRTPYAYMRTQCVEESLAVGCWARGWQGSRGLGL